MKEYYLHYFNHAQFQPLTIDFVRGVFNTFGYLNIKADHGTEFEIDEYDFNGSIYQSLPHLGFTDETLVPALIQSSKESFIETMYDWFFGFAVDDGKNKLSGDCSYNFARSTSNREFLNQLSTIVERVINPKDYYVLQFDKSTRAYGCAYELHVITGESKLYIFKFSVSD